MWSYLAINKLFLALSSRVRALLRSKLLMAPSENVCWHCQRLLAVLQGLFQLPGILLWLPLRLGVGLLNSDLQVLFGGFQVECRIFAHNFSLFNIGRGIVVV